MTPPNFPGRDDPAGPASLAGRPRVLVVGAGAIGGVVAAKLARAGHDVTALDANRKHVARLTSPGLRLDELGRTWPASWPASWMPPRQPSSATTSMVACATGVRPGEVAGIRPADLAVHTDADRPRAAGALAALLSRLGPTKASMSQDLERGSLTEVDVINGAVVAQAAALGSAATVRHLSPEQGARHG